MGSQKVAEHTEREILRGKMFHLGVEDVDVESGSASQSVTFRTAYEFTPAIFVVPPRGAAGTYSYSGASAGGFTMRITSESIADYGSSASRTIPTFFFCHER